MTPKEFFDNKFSAKVSEDPACMQSAGVRDKKIALDIEGKDGGAWTFTFDGEGKLSLASGSADPSAACIISMKDKTFDGMLRGKVNVPMAFVMRKIKVKGEQSLAVKLGQALQGLF